MVDAFSIKEYVRHADYRWMSLTRACGSPAPIIPGASKLGRVQVVE